MSDLLRLLDAYVAVAGGTIETPEEGLRLFKPAPTEVRWFRAPQRLLALDTESMDLHPEAEIALLGSRFAEDLLAAIRMRGAQIHRGFLAPDPAPSMAQVSPVLHVRGGRVAATRTSTEWLPLGRLHVAASVRTGHQVEDHLVETGTFDLTTGRPVTLTSGPGGNGDAPDPVGASLRPDPDRYEIAAPRPLEDILPAMLDDIEARLGDRVEMAAAEAERSLTRELARLDGYYQQLIHDAQRRRGGPDRDAIRAFQEDHERRKSEEIARNQANAELRPVQLELIHALAQQAEFILEHGSLRATVHGRKLLLGSPVWEIACPTCHEPAPEAWAVCTGGHATCSSCTEACSTCGGTSCSRHGGGNCIGGGPDARHALCSEHALVCPSCEAKHCAEHAVVCQTGEHRVCISCLENCDSCGAAVCSMHTTRTTPDLFIPGESVYHEEARALCPSCVRYCRGLKDEIRGRDEVELCRTCGQSVCEEHRGSCSVGDTVHCLSHLERTDVSRRSICPEHHGRCSSEPDLLLASDEVEPCHTCGAVVCSRHRGVCYADGALYCQEHVVDLSGGEFACAEHHGICVVDERPRKLDDLAACPVCDQHVCTEHRSECTSCGARVCSGDFNGREGVCRTCEHLTASPQPDQVLMDAFAGLVDEGLGRPKQWEEARDATRRVVRVTVGPWGRQVTFAVDHRDEGVSTAILHGVIFTKRLR